MLNKNLSEINPSRLDHVKLIVSEFDGVFTDNKVFTDENGIESIECNKYDSTGRGLLQSIDVELVVISSENNRSVKQRCKKLGLSCFSGISVKDKITSKLIKDLSLSPKNLIFIGNDVNDITALPQVGITLAVCDAHPNFMSKCEFVTRTKGGAGCIREICDLLVERKESEKSRAFS